MDAITRPMFMKFLTGSKRLPIGGFKNMQPNLKIVLKKELPGQSPDMILPSVMTCQNYVKCPNYSSYEKFKLKFDKAVSEGQQIFAFD
jgi:E3 ubiquitin-protein ligase TRIP12